MEISLCIEEASQMQVLTKTPVACVFLHYWWNKVLCCRNKCL